MSLICRVGYQSMFRMRVFIITISVLGIMAFSAAKLKKVKLNDDVTVSVPADFMPMTPEDREQRYKSHRLPLALYTDPDRLVDFGVNRSYSVWSEDDLGMLEKFYRSSIIELFDKVDFIDSGIKEVNKHQFVFFEFESVVYPESDFQRNVAKYTYVMYGLSGGTTYVFNFTCPKNLREDWQPIARQMMSKIKLK